MPTTNSINLIKCHYNQVSNHFNKQDIIQGSYTQCLYLHGDPLLPVYLNSPIFVGLIDTTAVVANGQQISFQAYISTSIKLGDEQLPIDLYIFDSINFEIIIGANFFAEKIFLSIFTIKN
jgi:hypothetical protein